MLYMEPESTRYPLGKFCRTRESAKQLGHLREYFIHSGCFQSSYK